ncbi:hypothetical protein BDR26DRAFT_875294 [Obelidium mucronatum]|nr:hypothetical protein BDR26DRAFT_875294 [Obelidium mucronatum]
MNLINLAIACHASIERVSGSPNAIFASDLMNLRKVWFGFDNTELAFVSFGADWSQFDLEPVYVGSAPQGIFIGDGYQRITQCFREAKKRWQSFFTYNAYNGLCWIKAPTPNMLPSDFSGVLIGNSDMVAPRADFRGRFDYGDYDMPDVIECWNACTVDTVCLAATWVFDPARQRGNCYFKAPEYKGGLIYSGVVTYA